MQTFSQVWRHEALGMIHSPAKKETYDIRLFGLSTISMQAELCKSPRWTNSSWDSNGEVNASCLDFKRFSSQVRMSLIKLDLKM